MTKHILPEPNRVLIKPVSSNSSFSTETKRYDRKAIGSVEAVGSVAELLSNRLRPGKTVIYDDGKSVDFEIDGTSYSIIHADDIVGYIQEEN
jgi:co-chaperonin GroES (HSP10)